MRIRTGIGVFALLLCCLGCNTAPKPDGKIPVTTTSEEARAAFLKGRELADNLRRGEAAPMFDEALSKDPEFAMAHLMRATVSNSSEEFFSHLKGAVANAGKASEGERLLIQGFEAGAMADSQKRGDAYSKLVETFPQDERAHQLLGLHYNAIQNFDGAVAEYKKSTELAPNFAPAYNQLGYALRAVEKNDEAEAAFRKYIELIPNEPNPYDSLAELLMRTGRFEESIEQYRKALSINPKFFSGYRGVAANLAYQGKHADALAELQKMHEASMTDNDRRDALVDMAIVLVDGGKHAEAIEKINAAKAISEKAGRKWELGEMTADTAQILLHQGKTAEAQSAFELAASLAAESDAPDQLKKTVATASHGNSALVAAASKDLLAAEVEAGKLREGFANSGNPNQMRQVHRIAGEVALAGEKWDDAIASLKQANQQSPQVVFLLAKAYAGKGDAAAAKQHFAKAANANSLLSLDYALIRMDAAAAAK